ncbi:MAG: hypothetical protein KF804_13890, partial [Burkholderiales bacterium]|nr:hypothetical protein [Burkholderiales bacterium]
SSTNNYSNLMKNSHNEPINSIPSDIKTYLAWTFNELLPGTFKRNKIQFAHLNYPILAPLPTLKTKTRPIEDCGAEGPFIYFVINGAKRICYIGKSKEKSVIKRWVRPGIGGPTSHYWTHSTKSGGSIFNIANGLRNGEGPFSLLYTPLAALEPIYGKKFGISPGTPTDLALNLMEDGLVATLFPPWNR